VNITVSVSSDLSSKYNAGQVIKIGLSALNGKGGGSELFAQGAGFGNINSAFKQISDFLQ